jgi:hypothetical protein
MGSKEGTAAKPDRGDRADRARKQDWIASQLRRVYDEALQEDIPDDMMALLAKLDDKESEA